MKKLLAFSCCTQLTVIRTFSKVGLAPRRTGRLGLWEKRVSISQNAGSVPSEISSIFFSTTDDKILLFPKMLSFENNAVNKEFLSRHTRLLYIRFRQNNLQNVISG